MEPREIEIEVWKDTADMWLVSMDEVVVGKHVLEAAARYQVKVITRLNKGIKFDVIG